MKVKPISLLILFLLSVSLTIAQNLPSYSERSILNRGEKTQQDVTDGTTGELILPAIGSIDLKQYRVGPGDILFLSLSGVILETFELPINPEGKVFIPKIGLIQLSGYSLDSAKAILREAILANFKDIEISISIIKVRSIKVKLIGNVSKPKSYILPANLRLSDLIINSGSLLNDSDIRNIIVIANNGERSKYDLLTYLRLGDENNNPYLHDDELVLIQKVDRVVSIFGSVLYPGTYEFVQGEDVESLLTLSGGFLEIARKDTIELVSYNDDGKELNSSYLKYEDLNTNQKLLSSGDKLLVRNKPEFMIARLVTIEGFVKFPGRYKIIKDKTGLKQLVLEEAGGFLENASLKDAYIERSIGIEENDPEYERLKLIPRIDMTDDEYEYFKAKSRQRKGRMVVDFERLFLENDDTEDLILKRSDKIFIPEKKDYITLVGQVQNPGNIIFNKNFTIDDYIELAGGFSWRAVDDDIRVIKASSGEWHEADEIENLNPGDIIWVPEETPPPKFWDVFTTSLIVVGQVATIIAALAAIIVTSRK